MGYTRYPLRLEDSLAALLREASRRYGVTQRAIIEEALRQFLLADAAAQSDTQVAPLINRVIADHHQMLGKSLRTLIVRLGHEMMRTQFVLYNFMAAAGIPEGRVESWREDGWRWATREFKVKPDGGDEDSTQPDR